MRYQHPLHSCLFNNVELADEWYKGQVKLKLTLGDFQGTEDILRVKKFLLGREPRQSLPDYWTAGKSTVGTFHIIFDSPISHHKFWQDEKGNFHAHAWIHPEPSETIGANPNSWRMLIHPEFRTKKFMGNVIVVAEEKLSKLTKQRSESDPIETVAYGKDASLASTLEGHGYTRQNALEVYMQRSLDGAIDEPSLSCGYIIRPLDAEKDILQRAGVQSDAFAGQPVPDQWAIENIQRFLRWYEGRDDVDLVAVSANGEIASFGVFVIDPGTSVGELDPVGTRASHQRKGLSKAVLLSGLQYMQSKAMTRAVVRTDVENAAAIRTYQSVGFHIIDHLYRYTKTPGCA
jgi:ribosomal protein S18 acetylase RimI-like enzyme